MKFIFKSDTLFDRAAKRLRDILSAHCSAPVSESFNFKDGTAYALGHADLRASRAAAKQAGIADCPWDEECTTADLKARRLYQAGRLKEYADVHGVRLENIGDLIARWQPSAARPQAPVLTVDNLKEMRDAGVPLQVYCLLLIYELTSEEPTPDDLELFRNGIKSSVGFINKALPLYIGPMAVRLVSQQTGPAAQLGITLLEMLCETPFVYAKVNLARALCNGWGVAPNLERARSLCKFVNKALDAGEDVFSHDVSRIDFYKLQGRLYLASSSLEERKIAFESYKKAAALGSGPAALFMGHYYAPLRPGMKFDKFSGVVAPDEVLSELYFVLAIRRGFNPVNKTFPEGAI
jgi:hypothetical protein